MPVMKRELTIKNFVVYTNENPNEFTVMVSDLEKAIQSADEVLKNPDVDKGLATPSKFRLYRFALDRALFIEQAIQEKLDREKG